MTGLGQDTRYALRGFRREVSFVTLAVLALGLGIGAATAIFSVIDNVLLDPWPYRDPGRIVTVQIHDVQRGGEGGRNGYFTQEFLEYRTNTHGFEDISGSNTTDVLYSTAEGTERLQGGQVTSNTFAFLGMTPVMGRGIQPEDGKRDAPAVFVMSYKMWDKYFDRDSHLLGRSFILNAKPHTLVGIMPPRFTFLAADLWTARDPDPADPDSRRQYYMFLGRMKPGITMANVGAEWDVIARRLAKTYPDAYPEKFSVRVSTLTDMVVGRFRTTLMTLLAAVGLLLFIACSNVSNMLLARATAREKEIAIRSALGASRWRIGRQLLLESGLLAAGGAILGTALAWLGIKGIMAVLPPDTIPKEAVVGMNVPVLLFSAGVAVLATLLAGVAPAWHAARRQLADPLKDTAKGGSGSFRQGRLRNALVVCEIALSLVLLGGAGLLMRTMVALQTVDLGLNPDNILVIRLPLPKEHYKSAAARQQFFSQVLRRIRELPGVVAVTETSTLPPYGGIGSEVDVPGRTHSERWRAIYQLCSEGYFPTLGLKLLRGRVLTEAEVDSARHVAVVNHALARKFFGNDDPIGRQIVLKDLATASDPVANPVFEVVGITGDAKNQGIQEPAMPEAFIPYTVTGAYERGVLVRTAREPMAMLNAVRREIWSVDRGVALTLTGSLKQFLRDFSYSGPQFTLIILAAFAGIGIVLVGIGAYSVIAYTVSRRTHDIGIRIALGARRRDIFRMVLQMGGILVGVGLAAGLAASLGVNRLISSQLWGVTPHDPVTLAAVALIIAAVGLTACIVPARRATRVDAVVSLRYE
jgi:putative ABC transport system permease protein